MNLANRIYLFVPLLIFSIGVSINAQSVDTVAIYKNKSAQGYSVYWKEWFTRKRFLYKSGFYEYSLGAKFTHQDSIVMKPPRPLYYKVYDGHNKLVMEGQTAGTSEELAGDIKYFYKNGKYKRVEHWDDTPLRDSCTHEFIGFDGYMPEGTWIYYRRNGTLLKTVNYIILPREHKSKTSCYLVAQIIRYSKKGMKKKSNIKELLSVG